MRTDLRDAIRGNSSTRSHVRATRRTAGGLPLVGCFLVFVIFNVTAGAVAFQWCLWALFGKDIPWYGDVICGLFSAEVAVPLGVVLWVLSTFMAVPFFG